MYNYCQIVLKRYVGDAERMGEERNAYMFVVGKLEGRDHSGNLEVR
jgi:hypothetical protein